MNSHAPEQDQANRPKPLPMMILVDGFFTVVDCALTKAIAYGILEPNYPYNRRSDR